MSTALQEKDLIVEDNGEEITPEKLLEMPDGTRYELVNGKLKEHAMGAESSLVAANTVRVRDRDQAAIPPSSATGDA